jgi:CheY-like chemotaxis protein
MTLSDFHLLIVDTPSTRACILREALMRAGCKVHVVGSAAAALTMVQRCRIDTAFVADAAGGNLRGLVEALEDLRIPCVFTGSSFDRPQRKPSEHAALRTRERHLALV